MMMGTSEAFSVLGIPPTNNPDLVKRRYREITVANHPDHAQDHEEKEKRTSFMVQINLAKEAALAFVENYEVEGEEEDENMAILITFVLVVMQRGYTHFGKSEWVGDGPDLEEMKRRKKRMPTGVDDILMAIQKLRLRGLSSFVELHSDDPELAWIELEEWGSHRRWCIGFFKVAPPKPKAPKKKPPPRTSKDPPPPPKPAHFSVLEGLGLSILKAEISKGSQVWGLQGSDHTILIDNTKAFLLGPWGIQLGVVDLGGLQAVTHDWLARIKADV